MTTPTVIRGPIVCGPAIGRTRAGKPRAACVVESPSGDWLVHVYGKEARDFLAALALGDLIEVQGRVDHARRVVDCGRFEAPAHHPRGSDAEGDTPSDLWQGEGT